MLGDGTNRPTIPVTPYERQAFLELAMQPAVVVGHRRMVLERWDHDPTIAITGTPTPEDLRHVTQAAAQWTLITRRHLTVTTGPAAVTLHFVPRAQFSTILDVDQVDPTAVGLTRVARAPATAA